ncbi:hypothetical protein [Acinetobacter soli]|uniref:Uncharacterized protein n=1 Tax=Acinetobacter soli TaxID=487316 RepID=A0AB38Z2J2_9GAMM|nr:hypothetical protein [Acinetobacter soli]KQD01194.1 hypothetical protein APD01_00260 [Acinetobacter soli]WND07577.1 hypothetical protein RHP80_18040 [Acinetobacter soli]WND07589.1 hypothetical protein RHP80_17980 [Acinetobacter soli]
MKNFLYLIIFLFNTSLFAKDFIVPIENNLDPESIVEIENNYDRIVQSIIYNTYEDGIVFRLDNKIISPSGNNYRVTFPNVKIIMTKDIIKKNKSELEKLKVRVIANKTIERLTNDSQGYYIKSQNSGYCFSASLLDKNNRPLTKTKYYDPTNKSVSLYFMAPAKLSEDIRYFNNDSNFNGSNDVTLASFSDEVNFIVSSVELANIGGLSLSMVKKNVANCHSLNL